MADRIQVRRDTEADWESENPTLADGEPGYVTDTGELVFGDGSSAFTSLGRFGGRGVLGYAEVTADQSGITSEVDLTGLSVTVDVASGRRIKVTAKADFFSDTANDRIELRIKQDGTQVQRDVHQNQSDAETAYTSVVLEPSAGSRTYKLTAVRVSGTGSVTMAAASGRPALILVEDIGAA